jgi:hypothetical protein
MSQSVSVVSDSSSSTQSKLILDRLPNISPLGKECSPYVQQQIDLLLLAVEALELGASEKILATINQLELTHIIPGRIALWRLRCSNPWRRSYTRNNLTIEQAKTLVVLAAFRAKDLEPLIRHLLDAEQQMRDKQLPIENHFRLSEYLERFRAHFRSRMNARRTKITSYLQSESELNDLALSLLRKLLFCTGTKGLERIWFSLFDGEV